MEKKRKFVVQRHQKKGESEHWDLMLEKEGYLETYRISNSPEDWKNKPVAAIKIFDHAIKFLMYEGPVNKGKGSVKISDCGTYCLFEKNDLKQEIYFEGNAVKGKFQLYLIEGNIWELKSI